MPAAPLPVHIMLSKRKPTQATMQHHSVYMNYNIGIRKLYYGCKHMHEIYKANHGNCSGKIKTNVTCLRSLKARAKSFPLYLQCLAQVRHIERLLHLTAILWKLGCWLFSVSHLSPFLVAGSRQNNPTTVPACEGPLMCAVGSTHYEVSHSWSLYCS